ncbi:peptide-methionine (S)-S-oxide reductase MsrA [Alloalcanivorax mobilis]|jgi:peptide-methionine (S)-S-oxide reductase|uniref:peptide-methionine (S)-S-oxide reductase MsrA n=1 Tax=Alloalcanivorax mobilis TaxID=2019569 RepID=UPI000B5B1380|nr:peptide-methionine (S)-S-oxide reductase MsrA [Alloalcanivorax mobilis]ASK34063.1 peptide-methionine (S)-S-oxide reductase [Alcanivorax sp. N3-2A]|tara:strand:- start:572 stop:1189 length:618 start_codon:yes stop_codon:yes gene_type:complete
MKAVIPGTSLTVHPDRFPDPAEDLPADQDPGRALLGGGCFWCVEAVYQALDGVSSVVSGYAGGTPETANYEAVCGGHTGHAEVVEVGYDPHRISYGQLLKLFFAIAHDPTQKDRQGNDRGPQYRSSLFPVNQAQSEVAARYIQQLDNAGAFTAPIVTTIEPGQTFYPAEDYHQDFARRNPAQPYIAHVARPKVEKLHAHFNNLLK